MSNSQNDALDSNAWALVESERRYRRLTESITDYVFTVYVSNGETVKTDHSANCAAVTGYTPDEFAANPMLWIRMVPPEDRPVVEDQVERILSSRDAPSIKHRICRKNNVVRWVLNTPIPSYDEHGNLKSYDGVVRDITGRKRAEERYSEPSGSRRAAVERCGPESVSSEYEPARIAEWELQHIADLLQEDLLQVLAAARYRMDGLALMAVHDPSFGQALDGVNDLLRQCALKARDISRKLTVEPQSVTKMKG